jgi:hypothetical protein
MADSINQQVVRWSEGQMGQQVGAGECWDLADRALKNSGANSSTTTGKNDDYVWGTTVTSTQVTPGDILQFRNYNVTTTTITKVTFDDDSGWDDTKTSTESRPHHTAVVSRALSPFALEILEQNVPPAGKTVQRHVLAIKGASSTTTDRKTMKDSTGKLRPAKVETTVKIEISGRLWIYRPKASK